MKTKLLLLLLIAFCGANAQVAGLKVKSISPVKANRLQNSFTGESTTVKSKEQILIEYHTKDISVEEEKINKIQTELTNNANNYDPTANPPVERFTDDEINKKLETIASYKKNIKELNTQIDSLEQVMRIDTVLFKKLTYFPGGKKSRAVFDVLYENEGKRFKALGNTGVSFGNNSGSIYSELVGGNLGAFRVSLGTMVSSSNSSDEESAQQEEAYQRLVTYGGNTVLTFEYPVIYTHSTNHDYNLLGRFIAKGAADLPAFGTTTDDWAGSASVGLNFYGDAAIDNNELRFFFEASTSLYFGTDEYQTNLGIDKSNFTFGQVTLGLVFLENFKISFVVTTFSSQSNLRNKNVVAGGQVLR
ncbi:hypothetical protein ABS768_13110 [Flavobacterium sp. ST-75]|uniref:Outer membrane beta-barrel porin/alpha-amylase n=1 Tax=Flavobacterium rhizophilum TaxID=3163296 RepID=A0ABW8YG42_9FLAO